ncbi:MAG TPA: hypothetical protein VGR07_12910 [Thermoanaerobaculia bacterium]|jgi:hypothetical protein|nr:hypothetical protein [Thermoanaerobaculia bacterium]
MPQTRRLGLCLFASALLSAGAAFAGGPFQFHSISPCRVADTRTGSGGILPSQTARTIATRGVCGIPTAATAVVVNATVVGPSATGFITLWPADIAWPGVATLTFNAGEPALGNGAIVPLGASTDMQMIYGIAGGSATTHVVIDATGYFSVN